MTDGANGRLVGGRYRLGPLVGSGGMGTVWRAHDELLHRDVAVKEVPIPQGLPGPEIERLRERYLREARAAARLRHAGVVGVYDVLPEPDRVWIVMEYVNARNLAEIMREDGPLEPERVAALGLQILDALDHAHRAGVLHRDVKPANVLVCSESSEQAERAVLTDFGVASVTGDSSLTRTGHLVGSPAYLAPERLTGGTVGPPSDLWSLGCTLFAATEGKPPFARDEQFAVITAITLEPVPPASRSGYLAPVLTGLLDKDPDQRWDAVRTRAALKRVADGEPVEQLSATSWGTAPAIGERPTWWMPAESSGPVPAPRSGAPVSGARTGTTYGTPNDWNGSSPGAPVAGLPPAGGGPSTPSASWQGSASVGYATTPPPAAPPRKRHVWRWLIAALLVVALAGAAGVYSRRAGWLDGSPIGAADPTPTVGASATGDSWLYRGKTFTARYPSALHVFCLTDPVEIKKQGHNGCFFDQVPADQHTDASIVLRSNPEILVIVKAQAGTAYEQLKASEAAAKSQDSFPGYTRIALTDGVQYGSNNGAVLDFTYDAYSRSGYTVPAHHVRIFRIVKNGTFYEVSLRATSTTYNTWLPYFEEMAGSITPK